MCQGRSTFSEPSVTAMPPLLGRITPRSILVNVHCLPLRWSSTVRLPPLRPISARSRPSRPLASRLSIQASMTAKSGTPLRVTADAFAAGAVARGAAGGVAVPSAPARSSFAAGVDPGSAGAALADAVTNGRLLPPAKTVTLLSDSILHRHFRADQAQTFGANAAGQQARAGDADFRLRRARHDGAFGVPHHDVANAQRRASVRVPLDLRAADLDVMARAEIFLDRRGEPRRRDVELDRTAGEPPPERDHRDQDETAERTADDDEFAHPRSPQPQSHQPRERACQARGGANSVVPTGVRRAQIGVEARLQLSESLEIRIGLLNRHAPTWRPLDHRFRRTSL